MTQANLFSPVYVAATPVTAPVVVSSPATRTVPAVAAISALLYQSNGRGGYTDLSNFAVERALLCLYSRQTAGEQASRMTTQSNGMGFTGSDAGFFTKLAEQIRSSNRPNGQRLSPKQFDAVRGIRNGERVKRGIGKYAGQLALVAAQKLSGLQPLPWFNSEVNPDSEVQANG